MKITNDIFETASNVARRFGAKRLYVFGSALDPTREPRDIDFGCAGIAGWKLFAFGAALEESLHFPVDVVPMDEPNRLSRMIESRGRRLV
jgi:predicted nucleotidyltransferase